MDKDHLPPNPKGHLPTIKVLAPRKLKLSLRLFSKESTNVNTEIIAKIPIVTPKRDKVVLMTFAFNAFQAKRKLSNINKMINFMISVS